MESEEPGAKDIEYVIPQLSFREQQNSKAYLGQFQIHKLHILLSSEAQGSHDGLQQEFRGRISCSLDEIRN